MKRSLVMVLFLVVVAACHAPLKPCPTGQVRGWCQVDVFNTTLGEIQAGCAPRVEHTTVTSCVDTSGTPSPGMVLLTKVTAWMTANYRSGILDYVLVGDTAISAKIARDDSGFLKCQSGTDSNPYGGSYVDLEAKTPAKAPGFDAPGFDPQASGAGGGTPADDCTTCLTDACPDAMEADLATCIHDHCAAVCPMDPATTCGGSPPMEACSHKDEDCGSTICCTGLACYPTDVGSVCM